MMERFFVDLHVHLGCTDSGRPIKVTASKRLTLREICYVARRVKGLDAIGVVDVLGPMVQEELRSLVDREVLEELPGGGLRHRNGLVLILGGEVETQEGAHILAYFPTLASLAGFSAALAPAVTNINLSSQRARVSLPGLAEVTGKYGGILVPAHAFTPHKGLYGKAVRRVHQLFPGGLPEVMPALELGLSADTKMAARILETQRFTFLSNSDAHSLGKLAREYNVFCCREPSWAELILALKRAAGRQVVANYGIDPRLGKYHRTWCSDCGFVADSSEGGLLCCPKCKNGKCVIGVEDRIRSIADCTLAEPFSSHPPYYHRIPLEFIPGIGPATVSRLLDVFGTELNIFHRADREELERVVGRRIAERIQLARGGKLGVIPGGGGRYGRIVLT